MELRQLKYFIAVAGSLNFSRAAESLHISQPTLSQQIAELEKEVGQPLFERTKRNVFLTPAGADMLDQAKDVLHRSEILLQAMQERDDQKNVFQEVCIGFEPNILDHEELFYALSHTGMYLRERYPNMRIFYRKIPPGECEHMLKNEDIDLAITTQADPTFGSEFQSILLEEEQFELVYCSRQPAEDTAETLRRILESRMVFFQEKELRGLVHAMQMFEELQVSPHVVFMDSIEATKLLIASGDGCIIVPESFRNEFHYDMVHYLSIDVPSNRLCTSVIWSSQNTNSAIRPVVEALQSQFPEAEKQ